MSIAAKKQEIADAVSAVPGVKCFTSKPTVLTPGTAWVRWGGWSRGDGHAFEATYRVIVVLPQQTESAADEWAYEHADALDDALRPHMFVDSFEPTLQPTEGQPRGLFTLTITGRSE
jgi:hypothetical protein